MLKWLSRVWWLFRLPSVALSPSAKVAVLRDMARITDYVPVASVIWIVGETLGPGLTASGKIEHRGPRWGVGYYDLAKVSRWRLTKIDGIRFTFLRQDELRRLNGATLDYAHGRYAVHEPDA